MLQFDKFLPFIFGAWMARFEDAEKVDTLVEKLPEIETFFKNHIG